jgi:hypothetical protein
MTEPFLFAMLSHLGLDLTSLLQSKDKGLEKGVEDEKKTFWRPERMRVVRRNNV